MMVVHRWGGGTERHVNDMIEALQRKNITVFLTRMDIERPNRILVETVGGEAGLAIGAFDIDASPDDYARLIRRLHVRHLHVQHLAGFPETAVEWLQRACTTAGVLYDVSLHDYMMICPRIVMVTESNT